MAKFEYEEKKHKTPLYEFNLDRFYFIVHKKNLLIFNKHEVNEDD